MSNFIDRQSVIDAIEGLDWFHLVNGEMESGASDEGSAWYKAEDVYKAVEGVPSVERKKGKWITIKKGERGYSAGDFRCSECGKPNTCYHLTAYCPNCGARME